MHMQLQGQVEHAVNKHGFCLMVLKQELLMEAPVLIHAASKHKHMLQPLCLTELLHACIWVLAAFSCTY